MKQTDIIMNIFKYAFFSTALELWGALPAPAWSIDQTSYTAFDAVQKKNRTKENTATSIENSRYLRTEYNLVGHAQQGLFNQQEGGGLAGGVDLNGRQYYKGHYQGALQYLFKRAALGLQWGAMLSRDETTVAYKSLLSQQEEQQRRGGELSDPKDDKQRQRVDDQLLQTGITYDLDFTARWKGRLSHSWQQDNTRTKAMSSHLTREVDSVVQLSQLQTDILVTGDVIWTVDTSYGTNSGLGERDIYTTGTRLQGDLPLPSSFLWQWILGYSSSYAQHTTKDNLIGRISLGEKAPTQRFGYRLDVGRSFMRTLADGQMQRTEEQASARNFVTRNSDNGESHDPARVGHGLYLVDEQHAVITYDFSVRTRYMLRCSRSRIHAMFQGEDTSSLLADNVDSQQVAWGWHRDVFGSPKSRLAGGVNLQLYAETLKGSNGAEQQLLSATLFYDMVL